jgi:hypothetical protein
MLTPPAAQAQGSQAPTPTPARLADHAPRVNVFQTQRGALAS